MTKFGFDYCCCDLGLKTCVTTLTYHELESERRVGILIEIRMILGALRALHTGELQLAVKVSAEDPLLSCPVRQAEMRAYHRICTVKAGYNGIWQIRGSVPSYSRYREGETNYKEYRELGTVGK